MDLNAPKQQGGYEYVMTHDPIPDYPYVSDVSCVDDSKSNKIVLSNVYPKIIHGDLLKIVDEYVRDMDTPVLVIHCCNCFHTMGAGIAKQLAKKWPKVLVADKEFSPKGDITKLGKVSYAEIHPKLVVANAYGQYRYGRKKGSGARGAHAPNVDYKALEMCLQDIAKKYGSTHTIIYPQIGAGLAGGDWSIIQPMIQTCFQSCNHIEVVYF